MKIDQDVASNLLDGVAEDDGSRQIAVVAFNGDKVAISYVLDYTIERYDRDWYSLPSQTANVSYFEILGVETLDGDPVPYEADEYALKKSIEDQLR